MKNFITILICLFVLSGCQTQEKDIGNGLITKEYNVAGESVFVGGEPMFGAGETSADFKPEVTLEKWGDETYLKVWSEETGDKTATQIGDKVVWNNTDKSKEYNFYPIDNGFEYEIILKEKPKSNVITLKIETKGLEFYYQPPINEPDGGGYAYERDIGSYAVYYKAKMNKFLSKKDREKYKTGKAFHIYRPQMEDANGWKVWGDLHIENGILTVTIPQDFIDKAKYPIKHATGLTFGNTDIQTIHTGGATNYINCSWFDGVASYGISISTYYSDFFGQTPLLKYAAYTKNSTTTGTLVEDTKTGVFEMPSSYDNWKEIDFRLTGGKIEAVDYWLCYWFGDEGADRYYDTVADAGGYGAYTFGEWPTDLTIADSDRLYSIYLTYEEEVTEDLSMIFYSSAGDGVVGSGYNNDWDELRATSTGKYVDYTASGHWSDFSWDTEGDHREYNGMRIFLPFDTSALPDNAIISSSTLYTYRAGGGVATSSKVDGSEIFDCDYYSIVQTNQASTSILTMADWNNCGDSTNPIVGGQNIIYPYDSAGYKSIKLNPTALSWISTTSFTMLGMRGANDIANYNTGFSTTTYMTGQYMYYSEDETKKPYLEVWYSVPEAESTCTYSSGDWSVLYSDNCNITSDPSVTGNIYLQYDGAGSFWSISDISLTGDIIADPGFSVEFGPGASFKVK